MSVYIMKWFCLHFKVSMSALYMGFLYNLTWHCVFYKIILLQIDIIVFIMKLYCLHYQIILSALWNNPVCIIKELFLH